MSCHSKSFTLKSEIEQCVICKQFLDHQPNPVLNFHPNNRILIIGQAPGTKVHETGIPWNDKSGDNLRAWMNIDKATFYDKELIGIVPMGFCYPGKGNTGDLPPRKECAPKWHEHILALLPNVELVLLIGKYAQDYYLGKAAKKNLTETVRNYQDYLPKYFVLPHPSPRNNIWLKRNDWFKKEVVPILEGVAQNVISQIN